MVGALLLGVLFLFLAAHFAWDGATHKGKGRWTFGGPAPYGGIGEDEHSELISEKHYKRQCYVTAGVFFVAGTLACAVALDKWKGRTEENPN